MGVSSLPETVTRQRRDCDLNPGPSALTTRLPSHAYCSAHTCKNSQSQVTNIPNLDARQSQTLARPATPLAACVQRHSRTTTEIGCHANVLLGIEKLISGRSPTDVVLSTLKIWRNSVRQILRYYYYTRLTVSFPGQPG